MPTYKRKPLQPLDPHRQLDRPLASTSSRPGASSGTSVSLSSSSVNLARTPTRLAELHGNAVEDRKARRFQEPSKGHSKPMNATVRNATPPSLGSGSGGIARSGAATRMTVPKAKERDSGKRRRDTSPGPYEGVLAAAAPSLPPARKRAKVVHGDVEEGGHREEEGVGKRKLRDTGVNEEPCDGDEDSEEEGERGEDDEAEAEDDDEYEEDENDDDDKSDYEDADEDSEYEDSPITRPKISPSVTRPNWMPVSMRLQHKMVQQEGNRVEWEARGDRSRRRSTRSTGLQEMTVATRARAEGGAGVSAGKDGKEDKAALRDSDIDDFADEDDQAHDSSELEDATLNEEDDEDEAEYGGGEEGGSEYEDDDSEAEEYEGIPERRLSKALTARTRTPVSMRLQQKLMQECGFPADHNLEARDNRTRASAIDDRESAAASGVDEEDEEVEVEGEEGEEVEEDSEDNLSDASEEGSEYSDSSLSQRTTRPRTTSARHGSRGPVSMRLQQKAMLDLEDGLNSVPDHGRLAHNDELRRGRSGYSRSPRRGAAYQVVQGLPTSTRLQEKRLRECDSVDVDDIQPAIAGTPQHARQTPGRTPKRVHWQGDSKASGTVSTPLSTRLQAKMVNEMEREDTGSVEESVIRDRICEEEEEDGHGHGDEEEELTDSGDETWREEAGSDSESQSGSPAPVGRGHVWLSGVRATRSTRKALRDILRPQVDEVEGDVVGYGCEDGEEVAAETYPLAEGREPCSTVGSEKGPASRNIEPYECRERHSRLHPRTEGEHEGDVTTVNSEQTSKLVAVHGSGVEESSTCRRSSRIADLSIQRSPLPNPPYVPRPCTALPRTPSKPYTTRGTRAGTKGKAIEVYVEDAEGDADEGEDVLERERQRYEDEVRRMRLGYPPRGRTEAPVVDYNAKNPVDWETSLGRQVAMRMQEMGYSVADV